MRDDRWGWERREIENETQRKKVEEGTGRVQRETQRRSKRGSSEIILRKERAITEERDYILPNFDYYYSDIFFLCCLLKALSPLPVTTPNLHFRHSIIHRFNHIFIVSELFPYPPPERADYYRGQQQQKRLIPLHTFAFLHGKSSCTVAFPRCLLTRVFLLALFFDPFNFVHLLLFWTWWRWRSNSVE